MIDEKLKAILKQSFANEPYPSKDTYQKLSEQLGLKKTTVYHWFERERASTKKSKAQLLPSCKFTFVCLYFEHVFAEKLPKYLTILICISTPLSH